MKVENQYTKSTLSKNDADQRAISHLRQSIARGKHWYLALLESIRYWNSTEEYFEGRHYKYLIDGEAFDWLELAERLCSEIRGHIPEDEMVNLLFYDRPPVALPQEEFKNLIGQTKYKAYLNFSYGVLLEDSLILAVMQEVRKEKWSLGSSQDDGVSDRAYKLIYGASEKELLWNFMQEKGYQRRKSISLSENKEFLYWLFKYRVKHSDNSRVASDAKKALIYLQNIIAMKKRVS